MSLSTILKYGLLSQGGAAPWTPASLSGLTAWYGDTVNGVDRSTLSEGTTVTTWNDQSGNGVDLTQIDSGYTVTYDSGNTFINFGTDLSNPHGLERSTAVIGGTGARTYFYVKKPISGVVFHQTGYYTDGDGTPYNTVRAGADVSIRYNNGSKIYASDPDVVGNSYIACDYNSDGTYGGFQMRKNGVELVTTGGANPTYVFDVNAYFAICSMSRTNPPAWITGSMGFEMAEFIAYNRALSTSEIEDVEEWLNDKYSIY